MWKLYHNGEIWEITKESLFKSETLFIDIVGLKITKIQEELMIVQQSLKAH